MGDVGSFAHNRRLRRTGMVVLHEDVQVNGAVQLSPQVPTVDRGHALSEEKNKSAICDC